MRNVAGRVRFATQQPLDVGARACAREAVGVAGGARLLHGDFRLSKAGLGKGAREGAQGVAVASRPVEVHAAELQARRGAENDVDEDLAGERFFGPPDEVVRAVLFLVLVAQAADLSCDERGRHHGIVPVLVHFANVAKGLQ